MKRLHRIFILAAALLLLFGSVSSAASTNVIFTAINNKLLPLSDSTMPVWFYDTPYVPYSVFTKNFGISSSYDSAGNKLTLFDLDHVLTYDLNLGFSYNQKHEPFLDSAKQYNGTIYIPAAFTAGQFGLFYTYFSTGPTIRLKTPSTLSDNVFITTVYSDMEKYLNEYTAAQGLPATDPGGIPADPDRPVAPVTPEAPKPIYLVFHGAPSGSCARIIDLLAERNIRATFILDGDIAANEQTVRKLVVAGHSVGLGGNASAQPDFYSDETHMLNALREQNETLDLIIKSKTRIVLPSGSQSLDDNMRLALENEGYRLWRTTYNPPISENDTPENFYRQVLEGLPNLPQPLIMRLSCDDFTADALTDILRWLAENNYSFHAISSLDPTPPAA